MSESYVQYIDDDTNEIVATLEDVVDVPAEGETIVYNRFEVAVTQVERHLKRPTGGDWQYVIAIRLHKNPNQ